ncbi:histidine phosphatase family protein [Paraburkholderia silvatlantica]|uniref:Broad specificity phosphatase PhoE n=1 Tax=Paraburkholderia silvatlantica TaxID=321895 RepID=A0A2V4UDI5_9BURK|nr:histidine phosphatase family protein [Paraburkholderia silvatlantica]PYE22387.1 broad specificity phosphatase PhoE [Paraburkholderia silvatlantica]TDQ89759.1 broad specificity phosphatase PhoE [Paraburkholderia silvatlantica]
MSTTVWLVSHAANAVLRSGTFPQAPDVPVPGDDAEEALEARALEALAAWRERWHARLAIGNRNGEALRALTSPAAIARASARAAGFAGATPSDALAETAFGAWQGRRMTDLAREAPEALAAWTRDPGFRPPGGGESFDDVRARVGAWLDALPGSGHNVIAFTHASVIRAAILHALGAPSPGFRSIEIAPLSATALRRTQHGWVWLAAMD